MEGAATKVAGKWFVAGVLPVGSSEEGEEGRRGGGDEKMKSGGDGRREMKRGVGGWGGDEKSNFMEKRNT